MEDWGESTGAQLAQLKETNNHKRYELLFQFWVLALLSALTVGLVVLDYFLSKVAAKDLLIVLLPAFTFVLGKMDTKNG